MPRRLHRDYLSQRHFSSVLDLNSPTASSLSGSGAASSSNQAAEGACNQATEGRGISLGDLRGGFTGGDLCFEDTQLPAASLDSGLESILRVTPQAGLLVAYASNNSNVHMVSVCE